MVDDVKKGEPSATEFSSFFPEETRRMLEAENIHLKFSKIDVLNLIELISKHSGIIANLTATIAYQRMGDIKKSNFYFENARDMLIDLPDEYREFINQILVSSNPNRIESEDV